VVGCAVAGTVPADDGLEVGLDRCDEAGAAGEGVVVVSAGVAGPVAEVQATTSKIDTIASAAAVRFRSIITLPAARRAVADGTRIALVINSAFSMVKRFPGQRPSLACGLAKGKQVDYAEDLPFARSI
jgi:hypothetical protein